MGNDVVVDMLQIGKLLVEMTGQQQRTVGQLPLADVERALAEFEGQIEGAQRDGDNKRSAAQDKPLNRAKPSPKEPSPKEPSAKTRMRQKSAYRTDTIR
ncbi:MAG TPA: hypothetical protein VD863_01505 [Bradyrhizobium sp.]|nr:hypothetical protein [Bradyrhizobium sp.]